MHIVWKMLLSSASILWIGYCNSLHYMDTELWSKQTSLLVNKVLPFKILDFYIVASKDCCIWCHVVFLVVTNILEEGNHLHNLRALNEEARRFSKTFVSTCKTKSHPHWGRLVQILIGGGGDWKGLSFPSTTLTSTTFVFCEIRSWRMARHRHRLRKLWCPLLSLWPLWLAVTDSSGGGGGMTYP